MHIYSLVSTELRQVEKEVVRLLHGKPKPIYGMLLPFIRRGGKRLRPALVLLCCKALNGDMRLAIRVAALTEIFHNFTLIHDDICDNSSFRRGKPTLHREYGTAIALNSGDALYTVMWGALLKLPLPPRRALPLQSLFGETFARVVEGQGEELAWYRNQKFDIAEKDYFRMIGGKTASLAGFSCRAGAFVAGASPRVQSGLQTFGEKLGLAFQIQDDVLNIAGNFSKYQKKIGEDISEGKRSLMVIHTMRHASARERARLISVLSIHKTDASSIRYVINLFYRYGALNYARKKADRFVREAIASLCVLPKGPEKNALVDLANYAIRREE